MHFFDGLIRFFQRNWHSLMWSAIILGSAIVLALIVRAVLFWALRRSARKRGKVIIHSLVTHGAKPTHWIFPLLPASSSCPEFPCHPLRAASSSTSRASA